MVGADPVRRLDRVGFSVTVISEVARHAVAKIIAPEWFGEQNGRHVLDNYPKQHVNYQEDAKAKADEIFGLLTAMGYMK